MSICSNFFWHESVEGRPNTRVRKITTSELTKNDVLFFCTSNRPRRNPSSKVPWAPGHLGAPNCPIFLRAVQVYPPEDTSCSLHLGSKRRSDRENLILNRKIGITSRLQDHSTRGSGLESLPLVIAPRCPSLDFIVSVRPYSGFFFSGLHAAVAICIGSRPLSSGYLPFSGLCPHSLFASSRTSTFQT